MSKPLIVDTQIVGSVAVPEYVKPAACSNEQDAYRASVNDIYKSYFNPEAGIESPNNPTLERRGVHAFVGFADENMVEVSRVDAFAQSRL